MKDKIKDSISTSVDDNISYLKELLKDNSDVVYREYYVNQWKVALVCVDGLSDKMLLDDFVVKPLMLNGDKIKNVNDIKDKILAVSDVNEVEKMSKAIDLFLSGDTLMLVEGLQIGYIIATRAWANRGISEPSGETSIRGSKEGFSEVIRFNTALIRRRVRDTRLKIKAIQLGTRSKTDTAIVYIDDIVNRDALDELMKRINMIDIDAILDSSYVGELIEDNKLSPFPQIQSTERPDVVAAAIYEGRIAIIVDNSPFVLIVPATLPNFLQTPDDYYERWMHSSSVRIIRLLGIFLSLILPALYVAVTSYHSSIIPTKLAYSIAASREGVPFPAFIEVIIMEISLTFLMEAIARLPKPIGSTIGIVGGLIIGQAAVSAGIVSPIMIIIIGITAITSFLTPNYDIVLSLRAIRFGLIIASGVIGLYGIMLGLIVTLIHLIRLNSFGISYLAPATNPHLSDMKDMYIKLPLGLFKKRPKYMKTKDKIRQK